SHCCPWRIFFSVFFTISGAIILFLVRWQFQKRHIASERVNKCHDELLKMEIVKKAGIDWVSEPASEPRVTERFSCLAIIAVTVVAITLVNWY
ncbi:MAG TPA: hypothetical protein VMW64_03575, partial [Dehalococcoidia bacterium]|nr:hypothetical protein [Dehalococcoidia bacterium]